MKKELENPPRRLRISNESIGISEVMDSDSSIDVMLFNLQATIERLQFATNRKIKGAGDRAKSYLRPTNA